MAESNKKGMISGMDSLVSISGEEFLEVIRLESDGSYKNYKLLVSKIRNNQGLSAYEVAVQNGFVGTEAEWLVSLEGKSAYQIAVEAGFVGDEAAFIKSLKGEDGDEGKSIYDIALENGFIGTEADFLKTLVGKSAYQSALDQGFVGTEAEFIASLKGTKGDTGEDGKIGPDGKSAFEVWQAIPGNADKTLDEFLEAQRGPTGESAFEAAKAAGYPGTEAEWLKSLEGKSAFEIAKELNPELTTEEEFVKSLEGKDAYEVAKAEGFEGTAAEWLKTLEGKTAYQIAKDNGFVGTEVQWLASLEGSDGTNGIDGKDGKSAYDTWLALPGNAGKTEAEFIEAIKGKDGKDGTNGIDGEDGAAGESAFETYKKLPGNANKTEAEFIASLKGTKGDDGEDGANGQSAYEIAVASGFIGTKDQWLASLVGATGEDGKAISVLATVTKEAFDEIVADGTSQPADAYIVDEYIYVFNGTDWVKSNSLVGPAGQGLNYLGQWPDNVALPLGSNYKAGDTYVWKNQGITSLYTLVITKNESGVETKREWVDIGVPGPKGDSVYQSWLKQPGNAGKTEAEFLEAMKIKGDKGDTGNNGKDGTNGVDGKDGLSAYEIAKKNGFVGTEAQWEASLVGPEGEKGNPAVAFEIKGRLTNESELPTPGIASEAYYVGKNLFVWLSDDAKWENFGSLNGDSAYATWLEQPGNAGKTEEEFLESLKGQSAFKLWQAQPGNAGKTEAEFLTSLKGKDGTNGTNGTDGTDGKDGTDGRNLEVKGKQANLAAIEALPNPADQDAWVADDTGHLHIYVTDAWIDAGKFRGDDGTNGKSAYEIWLEQPGNAGKSEAEFIAAIKGKDGVDGTNGTDGEDGAAGKSAFETYKELPGNANKTEAEFIASLKGADGKDGTNGTNGADGKNVQIKGSVANEAALPTGAAQQDAYTVRDVGHLFMWINTTWTDLGQFKGDKGDTGADGPRGLTGLGLNIVGEYATLAERPDPATLESGEAVYVLEDNRLYQVNDAGTYNVGIRIQGPQGEDGPQGPEGPAGSGLVILGKYDTLGQLQAAHPTGSIGDAYLVTTFLYGWIGGEWFNLGEVKGPKGDQGIQGRIGPAGGIGPKGPRGSLWLKLDVDTPTAIHGTEGDWAVNKALDVFYKTDDTNWIPYGKLTAGDVWKPLERDIKMVWLNDGWVALPIDAVANPAEGEYYVRTRKSATETEWTKLPKLIADLTDKNDTDVYVRVFKTAASAPAWAKLTLPDAGIAEAPTTAGKTYLRSGQNKNWVEYTGVGEAPTTAGATYVRSGETAAWVLNTPGIAAPADNKKYMRTKDAWVAFDAYDVANQNAAAASTATTFDVSKSQLLDLLNTSAGVNKTITFSGVPGNSRSTTAVVLVSGSSATVSFALPAGAPAGSVLKWNGGTDPVFQAGFNVLTFLIVVSSTGVVRIIGAVGSQTPTLT